ncbi:phosphoribosylanthranilate isomerase [Paenibacillus sp. ACRRX]|uniref:phosphoribosylanthranilate isomerase n=1 Tax=Paenibacillus sp. ACRRX TaxID=2918206 RepID=UPI001EF70D20|nr:phosphoribosylanthranilate isomerase [Paenibacillus sp. ACRRX]MCG7406461.1 phosphoribosylanthranilate isomerase [Paenibacillus sp. ACRRX]
MKVKICGLSDVRTLCDVAVLKPDHIGFVFAPSRRQITPLEGKRLIRQLQASVADIPHTVGVFAKVDRDGLQQVLDHVPLQAVQLHHVEDTDIYQWIKERWDVQIWSTISITEPRVAQKDQISYTRNEQAERQLSTLDRCSNYVDLLLLDTHDPVHGGGSGITFAWDVIPAYAKVAHQMHLPLYAAGGLDPNNVGSLLSQYSIQGVDVSSGVESNGIKDITKVASFIERVRSYDKLN